MAENPSRTPFNSFTQLEGDFGKQLQSMSDRVSELIAALRDWHLLNELGLLDSGVPAELQPYVDKTVKNTRRVLLDWRAIPESANLQSGENKP